MPPIACASDEQIDKITHKNAMNWFRFDPFEHYSREDLTVGTLRQKAKDAGVDTSPKSSGGEAPLTQGENRPVTSADIGAMFMRQAEADKAAEPAE